MGNACSSNDAADPQTRQRQRAAARKASANSAHGRRDRRHVPESAGARTLRNPLGGDNTDSTDFSNPQSRSQPLSMNPLSFNDASQEHANESPPLVRFSAPYSPDDDTPPPELAGPFPLRESNGGDATPRSASVVSGHRVDLRPMSHSGSAAINYVHRTGVVSRGDANVHASPGLYASPVLGGSTGSATPGRPLARTASGARVSARGVVFATAGSFFHQE